MKTKIAVMLLLFSKVVLSQNGNDRTLYMDTTWKEGTKDNYTYLRIVKDYFLDKSEYRFEDYYKNGKLQMEGNSLDKDYITRAGLFRYYYENGNLKSETSYENDNPKGSQTHWYENGVKKMESEYYTKEGETDPKLKINQYWSSEGKQQVINGNGFIDDSYEKGSSKGNLINGLKNGVWEGKDTEYNFSYTETYDHGQLISGKSIDQNNEDHTYTVIKLEPRPRKGISHFYKYIGEKFSIPKGSESIYGKMLFTFAINKDGDATDFKVVKSLGENLDNEAIRVIKKYPDWASGELRGIKVSFLYSIPIVIKEQ